MWNWKESPTLQDPYWLYSRLYSRLQVWLHTNCRGCRKDIPDQQIKMASVASGNFARNFAYTDEIDVHRLSYNHSYCCCLIPLCCISEDVPISILVDSSHNVFINTLTDAAVSELLTNKDYAPVKAHQCERKHSTSSCWELNQFSWINIVCCCFSFDSCNHIEQRSGHLDVNVANSYSTNRVVRNYFRCCCNIPCGCCCRSEKNGRIMFGHDKACVLFRCFRFKKNQKVKCTVTTVKKMMTGTDKLNETMLSVRHGLVQRVGSILDGPKYETANPIVQVQMVSATSDKSYATTEPVTAELVKWNQFSTLFARNRNYSCFKASFRILMTVFVRRLCFSCTVVTQF